MYSPEELMAMILETAKDTATSFAGKGLVINYGEGRGGLQNGKIAGPKLFAPPPPLKTG